jgi:hypothetical protein
MCLASATALHWFFEPPNRRAEDQRRRLGTSCTEKLRHFDWIFVAHLGQELLFGVQTDFGFYDSRFPTVFRGV